MSTDATPTAPAAGEAPTAPATPAPARTEPQDSQERFVPQKDVDRIVGERLGREREKFEREYESKIEAAKAEAKAETTKGFETKLVNTAAKSIARDLGFHDPADALTAIDLEKLPVKNGEADDEAIKKLLEELVKAKPYLAKASDEKPARVTKTAGKPTLPEGNPAGDGPKKLSAAEALRGLAAQKNR